MTAFYLASQSPRRLELLRQIGLEPALLLPDDDEDAESLEAVQADEWPDAYVVRVTALKLESAQRRLVQRGGVPAPILAADTTVALGQRILGKPDDAADAIGMLRALAGKTHRVLTAVAVGRGDERWSALSLSTVRFSPLSDAEIAAYVASGEPFGKAGAYAIQGRAAAWAAHIDGSYSGIMGLPLYEAAGLLRQAGVHV